MMGLGSMNMRVGLAVVVVLEASSRTVRSISTLVRFRHPNGRLGGWVGDQLGVYGLNE